MKTVNHIIRPLVLALLVSGSFSTSTPAQEVFIPDPGLNAAIRDALQKPNGPLTGQDLLSLTNLLACCRNISSLEGLEAAGNLKDLDLENNQLASFNFPSNLTSLAILDLSANQLTNVCFPEGLTNLATLILEANDLPSLTLPAGLTGLVSLQAADNPFTNLVLPADLRSLIVMDLEFDQLTNLNLPAGLTNLNVLALQHNQLTNLTLPPDMKRLTQLLLGGNPFTSLVLSEPLAATSFSNTVASLRNDGVSVFIYPPALQLVRPRMLVGAFQFGITGPPGVYDVLGSTDLATWSELGVATNNLGSLNFVDVTAHLSPRKFYRVRSK